MEADPWANAWQSSTTSLQDDEQDIGSKWEPPSWNHNESLWGSATNDDGKVWTSAYDNLPLGKSTEHLPEPVPPPAEEPPDDETDSESQQEPDEIPQPPSPTRSPPISPPGSPDAFGTFETGGLSAIPTISDAHWSSAQDSSEVAWGGAWAAEDEAGEQGPEDEEEAQAVDEWEAAKQQKAQQDKHVPPELLASILDQITEIFPAPPPTELDPADYRASRHKGLDVPVNSTYNRILPTDLTLPPTRPFPKSAVAKSTADALRLSRNAAFIRCSPLSHYSSTKGSTAWEASVKRRPDATGEPDLLPAGWRIVEPKAKEEPVVQKKHGGLLSFFGRRSGTPPVAPSGDGSPISPSSSPRASLDGSTKSSAQSTKSPTNTSSSASVKTISPTTSANTSPKPPPASTAPPLQEFFTPEDLDPSAGAPSAVSRFLGRFGRKSTGPKNLALSDGDFNFLSDIEGAVPNASGFAPITDFTMSTALLDDPVPLPAKLAPPPSAPTTATQPQRGPAVDDEMNVLDDFGTPRPAPPLKPAFSPPPSLASSFSAPAPPKPSSMSPVDTTDIDFAAWGFEDEVKPSAAPVTRVDSEPTFTIPRPQPRQLSNARASVSNAQVPARRAPMAIMSSGTSRSPAIVPKLDATFAPPPRASLPPALAPPPGSRPPPQSLLLDDDFADFSGPAPTILPGPASSDSSNSLFETSFSSSTSSNRGLVSAPSPSDGWDDFDDFMEASEPATLRTPSPPRPPAKSPRNIPAPSPLSLPLADDDMPLAVMQKQAQRAANHDRTRSLVENAATTSGVRWPAPASPLPDILPPPPLNGNSLTAASKMQTQQQAAFFAFPPPPPSTSPPILAPPGGIPMLKSATSPPTLPPPPGMDNRLPMFPAPPQPQAPVRVQSQPIRPVVVAPSLAAGANKSTGGLSAQDLSFFEGL